MRKKKTMKNIFNLLIVCVILIKSSVLANDRSQGRNDSCGVSRSKSGLIVYGVDFPRGSFPWIVALMHQGWSPPKYFCGGTLISKNFVISGILILFSLMKETNIVIFNFQPHIAFFKNIRTKKLHLVTLLQFSVLTT